MPPYVNGQSVSQIKILADRIAIHFVPLVELPYSIGLSCIRHRRNVFNYHAGYQMITLLNLYWEYKKMCLSKF